MTVLIKEISNIIIENNNEINENVVGLNYLEKLKYLVISNLKNNQDKFAIDNLLDDFKEKNEPEIGTADKTPGN